MLVHYHPTGYSTDEEASERFVGLHIRREIFRYALRCLTMMQQKKKRKVTDAVSRNTQITLKFHCYK